MIRKGPPRAGTSTSCPVAEVLEFGVLLPDRAASARLSWNGECNGSTSPESFRGGVESETAEYRELSRRLWA
jgi:hypothetical protein